ncbi:hypothetical protein B0H11DRAFT_1674380, partial [Mycena galericulata]
VRNTQPKPRAPLGPEERKQRNKTRLDKQNSVDEILGQWYADAVSLAEDLSAKYKKKPKYYLEMMFQGGAKMIHHQEKTNPYNAFKSEKAAECRERGESKQAPELHEEYIEEYNDLTEAEKKAYI